jgi:hypothetical protein
MLLLIVSLCGIDLVLVGYVSYFIYDGPKNYWFMLVFLGALLLVANLYLGFQIRYSFRIKKLMMGVHSKRFKSRSLLPKFHPSDRVYKAVRSVLKKQKIFYRLQTTKFRIPELGAYKHNLHLKKQGVRIVIKAGSLKNSRSGSILLVPEGANGDQMEEMMSLFDDAFGDGVFR